MAGWANVLGSFLYARKPRTMCAERMPAKGLSKWRITPLQTPVLAMALEQWRLEHVRSPISAPKALMSLLRVTGGGWWGLGKEIILSSGSVREPQHTIAYSTLGYVNAECFMLMSRSSCKAVMVTAISFNDE